MFASVQLYLLARSGPYHQDMIEVGCQSSELCSNSKASFICVVYLGGPYDLMNVITYTIDLLS